ncbi:MAG: type II secretion system F family protein [Gemmatimonadetes bacterium]|nr:type II secretion system F family protein [Gemmatimonadota bacterium]
MSPGTPPLVVGLIAFIAVVLAIVSIYLLYEAIRQWGGQREIQTELKKLTGEHPVKEGGGGSPLLRDLRKDGPDWFEQVVLKIPHRHDMAHFLAQADVGLTVGGFTLLTIGLGAALGLVALILAGGWIAPLLAAMVGALLPYGMISRKRRQRFNAFEEHFPEAIDLLGRAIRAGHAFSTGLNVVAEESPEPVSEEFQQVYEEQKFGLPLSESLLSLADRVDLLDVRIFVTAVLIQIESGGNLAEILDNLSRIIRDRFRFRRQLRVHTAHGRMTGWVLASAPFVAGAGMFVLNPDYMNTLFTEPLGRLMLAMAAGLQLIGFVAIRRVMDVEL